MLELKTTTADEPRPRGGLSDGGHVILKCSACGKELMDLWVVKPDDPSSAKVAATCCYCGDRSFEAEVKGRFAPSGMVEAKADDPEDYRQLTKFGGPTVEDGGLLLFTTYKTG